MYIYDKSFHIVLYFHCFMSFASCWTKIQNLPFIFLSPPLVVILYQPLICETELHSTSQSVKISHRSVLPVKQPDSRPGSSITHLLCPRRRLPPDPHDAAVIPASPLLSLSLLLSFYPSLLLIISCTTYTSSTASEWGLLCSMHAVAAASSSVTFCALHNRVSLHESVEMSCNIILLPFTKKQFSLPNICFPQWEEWNKVWRYLFNLFQSYKMILSKIWLLKLQTYPTSPSEFFCL